jgi:hypothetical protein
MQNLCILCLHTLHKSLILHIMFLDGGPPLNDPTFLKICKNFVSCAIKFCISLAYTSEYVMRHT